jgi:hypothetical protein
LLRFGVSDLDESPHRLRWIMQATPSSPAALECDPGFCGPGSSPRMGVRLVSTHAEFLCQGDAPVPQLLLQQGHNWLGCAEAAKWRTTAERPKPAAPPDSTLTLSRLRSVANVLRPGTQRVSLVSQFPHLHKRGDSHVHVSNCCSSFPGMHHLCTESNVCLQPRSITAGGRSKISTGAGGG